jgi:hypothetical protein
MTLVFTDDRKSFLRDTITNELSLHNFNASGGGLMVHNEMDNFIRNNGFNSFKI